MWVGCIFLSPTWRDRGLGGGPDWAAGREGRKCILQKEITCTVVRLEQWIFQNGDTVWNY